MMKFKKRFFTLLEILISLGLALLIISTLLISYLNIEKTAAWWKNEEDLLFQEKFFAHRLFEIFNQLEDPDQNKTFFFTTQTPPSLVFSYNNGVLLDPSLSSSVLGRLMIEPNEGVVLLTWPARENWESASLPPFHREMLLKGVEDIKFSFFHIANEEAPAEWKESVYSKDLKELPGAIKIELVFQNGSQKPFFFPIPQTLSYIKERA